jgi:thiazole synthase ThiGH ThiG subunit
LQASSPRQSAKIYNRSESDIHHRRTRIPFPPDRDTGGKYKSFQETARALEASGADMVTVAVRRVNLDRSKESLLDYLDPKKYFLLPNTAGCYTADEAIRAARLGREVGLSDWVKLEVIGDQATLYPDIQATLEATRVLVKEGLPFSLYLDDMIFTTPARCQRRCSHTAGCSSVMA